MDSITRYQINVFISSAQNEEDGFDWTNIRKKIKDKLATCPYIKPFIIEDVASTVPSTQLFAHHVKISDIVVFLFKSELRKGTATEYTLAKKYKKNFLVYFLSDSKPTIDLCRLQQELEQYDFCTYCGDVNADEICDRVFNDVINDVITHYQIQYDKSINEIDQSITLPNELKILPYEIPNPILRTPKKLRR